VSERLRIIPGLRQRDGERATVGADREVLYLGFFFPSESGQNIREPQALTPWTITEARQLRDWLTQALPCEHKGARSGTMRWNEPTVMTCNECGAEVPSFYTTQN
jgi:hypothetical protein